MWEVQEAKVNMSLFLSKLYQYANIAVAEWSPAKENHEHCPKKGGTVANMKLQKAVLCHHEMRWGATLQKRPGKIELEKKGQIVDAWGQTVEISPKVARGLQSMAIQVVAVNAK